MTVAPQVASFKQFARIAGCKPGYVTHLRKAERLVLTEDGKAVRVAESLRLIADTRDPAKAGVTARHAAQRAAASPSPPSAEGDGEEADREALPTDPVEASHARRRVKAQADRDEALARKTLRDEQLELGTLMLAVEVELFLQLAAITLRNALENLPNILAPELAASTEEGRCRVLLQEAFEHALEELSRRFAAIGKPAT